MSLWLSAAPLTNAKSTWSEYNTQPIRAGYYLWTPHVAKPDGSNVNAMHMNHCGIIVINWSATFKDFITFKRLQRGYTGRYTV